MLGLVGEGPLTTVLCLGAHCDDVEIGCGGTLMRLGAAHPGLAVHWVVFSGDADREGETRRAAQRLVGDARLQLEVHRFRDGFFPFDGSAIKEQFEAVKRSVQPDLIFTHHREDRHQDHRLVAELTWNTFRDHWVLEYEIPKYDGDLGKPNVFVPLSRQVCRGKSAILMDEFASQRQRSWFSPETFEALARLRGVECNAPEGYAEGFLGRKLTLFP
ncbi:MAG: PIG-L family deacetylase [Myxococcales bacterium]|nr:PIG-L family deacetylase [Myxococcales bacterium]MDD9970362.1 PIG-L family deacetylase [Myxococcales bacterium]